MYVNIHTNCVILSTPTFNSHFILFLCFNMPRCPCRKVLLKVWYTDRQHEHHLGICSKCKFVAPPHPKRTRISGGVGHSPSGYFAHPNLRSTDVQNDIQNSRARIPESPFGGEPLRRPAEQDCLGWILCKGNCKCLSG